MRTRQAVSPKRLRQEGGPGRGQDHSGLRAGKDSWRVKSIQPFTGVPSGIPLSTCELAAFGVVQIPITNLAELRQNLPPAGVELLPQSLLKHTDDQTIAGLAAVFEAMQEARLSRSAYRNWGVVASSRFLGRAIMTLALQRFQAEGAWGVSPHLIPHRSLHSLSGTISQVLKIHGPNFGAGGGPEGAVDALVTAMAMLQGGTLPGIWVVLTGWYPELACDAEGRAVAPDSILQAAALMLTPLSAGTPRCQLRLVPCATRMGPVAADLQVCPHKSPLGSSNQNGHGKFPLFNLEGLVQTLAVPQTWASLVSWRLAGGGWIELERKAVETSWSPAGTATVSAARDMERRPVSAGLEKLS